MTIVRRPLPDRMLVLPNSRYFFGARHEPAVPLRIVHSFVYGEVARIVIADIGAFGYEFMTNGRLASIDVLEFREAGLVPEEVIKNHDHVIARQADRVAFANFVAASIFGRFCGCRHRALEGAIYCGLNDVFSFGESVRELLVPSAELERFMELAGQKTRMLQAGQDRHYRLTEDDIADVVAFLEGLRRRGGDFEYVDLESCIVMNYQAAILHEQQHAGGSLALSVAVIESLIHEIFFSYGLVGNRSAKALATKQHNVVRVSNSEFRNLSLQDRVKALHAGCLVDEHLCNRIDRARERRNGLMHRGETVNSRDSGDGLTVVRDLWAFLIETPFELNTGWQYRY